MGHLDNINTAANAVIKSIKKDSKGIRLISYLKAILPLSDAMGKQLSDNDAACRVAKIKSTLDDVEAFLRIGFKRTYSILSKETTQLLYDLIDITYEDK